MDESPELWYQVGYSMETLRRRLPDLRKGATPSTLFSAVRELFDGEGDGDGLPELWTRLAVSFVPTLVHSLPRWDPRAPQWIRGGAAGAGAALVVAVARPALRGRPELPELDEALLDEVLSGVGRGLLYAGLIEAHLPGSALVRGATFGVVEGLLAPFGGTGEVFGSRSPHHRIPLLGAYLDPTGPEQSTIPESLLFGITLGILYGEAPEPSESSNGTSPET